MYTSGHKLVFTYKGLEGDFPYGQIVVLLIYFSEASGASLFKKLIPDWPFSCVLWQLMFPRAEIKLSLPKTNFKVAILSVPTLSWQGIL